MAGASAVSSLHRVLTAAAASLLQGPSVPVMRRHAKSDRETHYGPAYRVVSGNYVAAKRRGIIDGVDFGYTGEVRVQASACFWRSMTVILHVHHMRRSMTVILHVHHMRLNTTVILHVHHMQRNVVILHARHKPCRHGSHTR